MIRLRYYPKRRKKNLIMYRGR